MIVAKTDAARGLAEQIKDHSFKGYDAVVIGRMKEYSGVIDAPIGEAAVTEKASGKWYQ